MKFRTEIEIAPFERKIDHTKRGFSVGSCFAEAIAGRLRRLKFPLVSNPTGVLYNPFSIADLLEGAEAGALAEADYVLMTFGTAWVFETEGRVVANCEKRPAHLFTRRRLSVEEIAERFDGLLGGAGGSGMTGKTGGVLGGKQVIFSVSPVRHLKDGFEENSLSKAVLRLAIEAITERHPGAHYFPAYEIVNDDLRDYRFYAADLAHPSREAVQYIWEKFSEAVLDSETLKRLPEIENIMRATEHRPFEPGGEEHSAFRRAMLARACELQRRHPELDLGEEIEFFGGAL